MDDLSPQTRQSPTDDVPLSIRQRIRDQKRRRLIEDVPQSIREHLAKKRQGEMLDDVPLGFKRTRGATGNVMMTQAFVAERSEAYQARVTSRGKNELNIVRILKESANPDALASKLQAALEKE